MTQPDTPRILIIDDEVQRERSVAAALQLQGLDVEVRSPDLVTRADLTWSNVIAIDHHYNWGRIAHPEECLYWPQDGLALAAVVAGHLRQLDHHAAIVLRTGALAELAGNLPTEVRKPIIASQNGLDWILTKGDVSEAERLHEIAHAVNGLQMLVSAPLAWNEGCGWLDVPDSKWMEAALADVQVCHPPENTVAAYTAGTAWLRWFAHRVLPFPSFLLPAHWAAALLRLEVEEFCRIAAGESALSEALRACRYTGQLAGLVPDRWWRAGLDALVDTLLLEASPDLPEPEALAEQMSAHHGSPVQTLHTDRPVVTIDSDYSAVEIADAAKCVRLVPDFWPVFAQEPWASFEDLHDDPPLFKMVARGDRRRAAFGEEA
ncbi:hypothetical protein ACTMS0_24165 [Micromonospora sp. H33]|uniref:hypothetical protein n=1 Tax=Micromonospora sp. H33 TaxID=3452215 RepID=UPI003F8B736F